MINKALIILLFVSIFGQMAVADGFKRDLSNKESRQRLDFVVIEDLVVGEAAFVDVANFCWENSLLRVWGDAEISERYGYFYSIKAHREPGLSFRLELIPPSEENRDLAEAKKSLFKQIVRQPLCSWEADFFGEQIKSFVVSSIDNVESLSALLDQSELK